MAYKLNPITGLLDITGSGGGTASIPQYDADPSSPSAQDAWVLRTTSGGGVGVAGVPMGLLLALTYTGGGGADTYQFSYRTNEGTTVRVSLT